MKILYVVHSYPPYEFSGTPLITRQYARLARQSGADVAVAFAAPAEVMMPAVDADGVRLLPLWKAENWLLGEYVAPTGEVPPELLFRGFRPDIVHVVDWFNLPAVLLGAVKKLGVPVIRQMWNLEDVCAFCSPISFLPDFRCCTSLRGEQCAECMVRLKGAISGQISGMIDDNIEKLSRLRKEMTAGYREQAEAKWQAFGSHLADVYSMVLFPCQSFRDYYESIFDFGGIPRRLVEHGCTQPQALVPKAAREGREVMRFVFLGPCHPRKGWHVVEDCFARLLPEFGDRIALRAYGGSHLTDSPLWGRPGVELLHSFPAEDLGPILANCDIGLIPTPFETLCRVAREMLSYGLPVIGSDAFGIPDVVKDGLNGLMIGEPTSERLEQAIRRLLADDGLLDRLRDGAAQTKLHSPDDEFRELHELYRELIPRRS